MRRRRWIAVVFVVLVAVGWGVSWWLAQNLAEHLSAILSQTFQRPVTLTRASLHLLPLQLSMHELRLAGPTADSRPLLEAQEAHFLLDLGALRTNTMVFPEVRLQSPRLFLHRFANGTDNFPRRAEGSGIAAPMTATLSPSPSLTWQIDRLVVENGQVEVRDEAAGFTAHLAQWELEAGPIRPGAPIPFHVATRWQVLETNGTLRLENARLSLDPLRIEAQKYTAAIAHPQVQVPHAHGSVDVTLRAERAGGPSWGWMRAIQGHGSWKASAVSLGALQLAATTAEFQATEGRLRVSRLEAKLAGGVLHGSLSWDGRGDQLAHRLQFDGAGIDVATVLTALGQPARLRGTAAASAELQAHGTTAEALIRSLDGELALELHDGAIFGVPLGEALRGAAPLLTPPTLARRQDIAFTALAARGPVHKGTFQGAISGHGPWFLLQGNGQLQLPQRQLAANLQITATAQAAQELGPLVALAQGIPLPVQVRGPVHDPAVQVDFQRLLRQRAPGAVDRLLRQPQGNPQELLRGLLGQ